MRAVTLGRTVGWFHPASSGRAAVVVGGHGYEDLCSRSTLGALATDLAAAGVPTLRVDLSDTGDAGDLPADADRVEVWIEEIGAAIEFLRQTAGAAEIVLVGLRLGALLTTAAAIEIGNVDRLVLMAPPVDGRSHRRELSILARLVDAPGGVLADGSIEIGGFRLDAPTLDRLQRIDLAALAAAPAPRALVVGEGNAATRRVVDALQAVGTEVETIVFDGYARMMCDPTASEPALTTVAAMVERLAADAPAPIAAPRPTAETALEGEGWVEERFVFADGLVGVLCRPAAASIGRSALWLNSGRNHHIGWARQTVDLSRRLARHGVAVLRIDLAGIGDSPARADTPAAALYHAAGRDDVIAAIDEMARRGLERPWVIGACSGAYQAFHTALVEPRIAGIALVNQLCFVWDASYAIHLSAWMTARPHRFEADTRQVAASGGTDAPDGPLHRLRRLARKSARIGLDFYRRLRLGGGGGRNPGSIIRRFRELSARGVGVSIILTVGDRAVTELELHTGRNGEHIAALPGVEIVWIPDADHSLSPAPARALLGDHLLHRLTGRRIPRVATDLVADASSAVPLLGRLARKDLP